VAPDLTFLRANAAAGKRMQPAITWIGHASVLAQFGGLTMLTDPIFSERASPLDFIGPKRAQPPGVALADLPHVDLVVVSHNHYDHLDLPSLRALAAQPGGPPVVIVPLGNKALLDGEGIANVVELDWWQGHSVGPAEVVLTPVQHWSARGLTDRMRALWGGFAVFTPHFQLFHAGDTGYSPDFKAIRQRFAERQRGGGFDLALLPIGGYEPRWFMRQQHVNPDEAVRIHRDLGARTSFGMHWGTFELTDESLDEPPRALADARRMHDVPDDDFFVLAIGQTRRLAPRR
jgi:N-acyl-phosphatidylethanolamine-hydrolysing phospholipase D